MFECPNIVSLASSFVLWTSSLVLFFVPCTYVFILCFRILNKPGSQKSYKYSLLFLRNLWISRTLNTNITFGDEDRILFLNISRKLAITFGDENRILFFEHFLKARHNKWRRGLINETISESNGDLSSYSVSNKKWNKHFQCQSGNQRVSFFNGAISQ